MKFESDTGVKYWFDSTLGISIPLNPELENALSTTPSEKSIHHYNPSNSADTEYATRFMKKIEKIKQRMVKIPYFNLSPEELKHQILREGLLQLTLGVTEDCNLACKYCYFSEVYPYSRNSSRKMMTFATAKCALDYYISLLREGERFNPNRNPTIGFYGGEPLLNFDLIRKCVSYFEEAYPKMDPLYTITTNGTLLDEKKLTFLMAHNFSIAVSIDGPEMEHNRNRVYRNGSGTFADIMKNIKPMIDAGYKQCHSLCVFDWKSDLFALNEFFNRQDIPRLSTISVPNENDGCIYYKQFTKDDYIKFKEEESKAFSQYILQKRESGYEGSFFDNLFGLRASRTFYNIPVLIDRQSSLMPYTGACLPGRKIFVDVDGNYHTCERINHTFPIGNVKTGLDFTSISSILKDYLSHLDQCSSCQVQKLCGICYCAFASDGKFKNSTQICSNVYEQNRRVLSRTFTVAEKNPRLLGSIADDYYSWLAGIVPTLED